MGDTPDFSVVIPTYNGRPYVSEALRSVFAQTHDSYEVIVSDDGSDDGTVAAVESLLAGREDATLLRHGENRGLAENTNAAVERATGRYLAFLDQDDRWAPGKLRAHLEAHEAGAAVVYSDNRNVDADGNVIETVSRPEPPDTRRSIVRELCHRGNFLASMSFISIRRDAWERVGGFDDRMTVCADLDLLFRLARVGTFRKIPEPLASRRHHGDMRSSDYRAKYRDNERIGRKLRDWRTVDGADVRRFTAIYTENRALGAFRNDRPAEAVRYALRALGTRPQPLSAVVLVLAAADLCTGPIALGRRVHAGYRRLRDDRPS